MKDLLSQSTVEVLKELHTSLDAHFRTLYEARGKLTPPAPVFALEHGLSDQDLQILKEKVRAAVRQGFKADTRQWWLPFVVYASESGYEYSGGEYWQTFEVNTPYWDVNGDRDRIGGFFQRFASDYGGARPQGHFARFTNIAWPITNAVLPLDLQRYLARLLFEFRTGLTAQLLQNPVALGVRLAGRVGSYTERFRLFCENTDLLGQVSVALLLGEDDESFYLERATLRRIVDGLSRERQSRVWLDTARRSATQFRTVHGFVPDHRSPGASSQPGRLPSATDPRLFLRKSDGRWLAYAEFPDLSSLTARLPDLSSELRARRPRIAGAERDTLARGQLLYPGLEIRLARWPKPDQPFISLERGTEPINALLADQCVISPGPIWLFGRRASGQAIEVKGKLLHPGASYVLVTTSRNAAPQFPWVAESPLEVEGAYAFNIAVPQTLSEADIAALRIAGVSVATDVTVRPVGVVASNWDGEGAVEWLAGEPGMIGISAEQTPDYCVIALDGERRTFSWPDQQRQLLLRLDDVSVGSHEVSVAILADDGKTIAEGALIVTIRDPQVRPEGATAGEGIRLLADPAQPTLSDLWDNRATLSIDGPPGSSAQLNVVLLSESGKQLALIPKTVNLPVGAVAWAQLAASIRDKAGNVYDDAQSARITVTRSGIGLATLTCDRGFQALRWRVTHRHNSGYAAHLIDRTDGVRTKVSLFHVGDPMAAVPCPVDGDISLPPVGGLLSASAGQAQAVILLPTEPKDVLRLGNVRPTVRSEHRTPGEVERLAQGHCLWADAEQPADPFARHQLDLVLDAITREIVCLVAASSHWASLERRMKYAQDLSIYLDDMERSVGEVASHRELARQIARNLWDWSTLEDLYLGFAEAVAVSPLGSALTVRHPSAARFLLNLASQASHVVTDWGPAEREEILREILAAPVLLRAARFAVLGTRAIHGQGAVPGGDR